MKITIETNKTKNEILEIIKKNTNEVEIETFAIEFDENDHSNKFFNGKINEDSFEILRDIKYRNSFLPILVGNIVENDNGLVVNINSRYNKFVKIFMFIWFFFVVVACVVFPLINFGNDMPVIFHFVPYIILVFGIILSIIPYRVELGIAKKKLEELLQD